ncbi:MAG: helix-turn-helix transcriptional regulator [Candidatus Jacksonbacteria bacterium]|jgi:predicted transcriptional regulator|nr:helix-turn-helix transcriptional regulator [Candidatus Jacksonbacteria bacterium]
MTLQEIGKALQDRRLDIVSEKTGISRNTIADIRKGTNVNPNYKTLKTLEEYLQESCNVECDSDK